MIRVVALLVATAVVGLGQGAVEKPSRFASKKWVAISTVAVLAAHGADIHSSLGRQELNPVLRGSDGRFGAKGVSIKLGIAGVRMGVMYLFTRRRHREILTWTNFVDAGLTGGMAARNYRIH